MRARANKMTLIAFVLVAYILGSISFGVLASRLFHLPDPRSYGSKNPGATNVLRSGKKAPPYSPLSEMRVKAGWR